MKQKLSSLNQDKYVPNTHALRDLNAFVKDEDGNATVPFVVMVALSLSIFFATVSPINSRIKANLYGTASWIVIFSTTSRLSELDNGAPPEGAFLDLEN